MAKPKMEFDEETKRWRPASEVVVAQEAVPVEESPEEPEPEPSNSSTPSAVNYLDTLLADMRWVYTNPKRKDRTEGQKAARAWKEKDIRGFMTQMSGLEKSRGEGDKQETIQTDEGTIRVLDLIQELFDRWEVEKKRLGG